jgi:hypothetical protein
MTLQYADFPDPTPQATEYVPTTPDSPDGANEWAEVTEAALSPYNQDLAAAGHVPGWSLE